MSEQLTADDLAMSLALLLWQEAIELEVIAGCDEVQVVTPRCRDGVDEAEEDGLVAEPGAILCCLAGLFDACDEDLAWDECIARAGKLVLEVQIARATT